MPRQLLITAGPAHEPIDPVRYLANRSSGKLGIELARAAHAANRQTTLLLGPTPLAPPPQITTHRFESTADLEALLRAHFPACDTLIMAAAVADFRPAAASTKKRARDAPWSLALEPTPDLVAACAARKTADQRILAFALEHPDQLHARAAEKLARKRVDAIVANPLETMNAANIDAAIITAAGKTHTMPPTAGKPTKAEFARWLIYWISTHW